MLAQRHGEWRLTGRQQAVSCTNCGRPQPVPGAYCTYCAAPQHAPQVAVLPPPSAYGPPMQPPMQQAHFAPAFRPRRLSGPATGITVLVVLALLLLMAEVGNREWYEHAFNQAGGYEHSMDETSRLRDHRSMVAAVNLGLGIAALMCGSAIAITFLVWLHRARRNLAAIPGADPQWSEGWTVGAWFIPLAGYILGPMVVGDVSRATYAGRSGRPPAGLLTAVWMLLWTPAVAVVSITTITEDRNLDTWLYWSLGGWAVALLAMSCLLTAVRSVTRVQREVLGS